MEVVRLAPKDLKPWDKNPRKNDPAVDAVAKSIQEFGFNVPILCDRDHTIIAGHTRWKAAKKLKLETVPVIFLDLTDSQRVAFSIADNKTAEIATWDYPELADILKSLNEEEFDFSSLGFQDVEIEALLQPVEEIDWAAMEENTHFCDSEHVRILVKVKPDIKDVVKTALKTKADELGIKESDQGVMTGQVLLRLLEIGDE